MSMLKQLASSNYISVNKSLIKIFGLTEAVLLGELCSEYDYWEKNEKLEDNMFYSSVANIEENTGLSDYQQRQAIQSLKSCGVLETELKGLPATRYFRINEDKLFSYLRTSSEKTKELDVKKLKSNNNITNKNKEINNNSKELLTTQRSLLEKPKKKNLYQKCVDLINDYTENEELRTVLGLYLKMRLEIRDKPMYANMWKGLLNKLTTLADSDELACQIVQQSLDRGYLSFFNLSTYTSKKSFVDSSAVKHKGFYEDEDYVKKEEELRDERKRNGQRTEF